MIDHLDEDIPHSNGMMFAAISFASSKTRQRIDLDDKVAVRVRGAFKSTADAMEHVKRLDRVLDTYVCDMYRWILLGNVTPDMDAESHLIDMVKAHRKRNEQEKMRFEERKKVAMETSIDEVPDHLDDLKNGMTDVKMEDAMEEDRQDIKRLKVINEEEEEGQDAADGPSSDVNANGVSLTSTDSITVTDQQYVVLSYVEPDAEYQELETPTGVLGVKIRGVFSNKDEAEAHIKDVLTKLDPDFDILVADMYKFLVLPCDHDAIDTVYREPYLQEMFQGHKKSQTAAQTFMRSADTQGLERVVHPTELKAIEGN